MKYYLLFTFNSNPSPICYWQFDTIPGKSNKNISAVHFYFQYKPETSFNYTQWILSDLLNKEHNKRKYMLCQEYKIKQTVLVLCIFWYSVYIFIVVSVHIHI